MANSSKDLSLLTKEDMVTILKIMLYRSQIKHFEAATWYDKGEVRRVSKKEVHYIVRSNKNYIYKAVFTLEGEVDLGVRYHNRQKYAPKRIMNKNKAREILGDVIQVTSDLQYSVYEQDEDGILVLNRRWSNLLGRLEYKPTEGEVLVMAEDDPAIPVKVTSVETYLYASEWRYKHIITIKKFY